MHKHSDRSSMLKRLSPVLPLLLTACGGGSDSSFTGPGTPVLSASITSLALAVSNTGLSPALTGNARTITITNTGTATATSVGYTPSPALPAGTTITPSSCGDVIVAGSCVLTVTPGATPSAAVGDASPTPIVLSIAGSNTNTLNPSINILEFGSVYQSGYVFSIDDTTPSTGSIGGKVAALTDQSAGVIWSSNSFGTADFTSLYGIDETSTTSSPSPSSTQVFGQAACDGALDGACNTQNIIAYYSLPTTNPAVNLSYYAAGLCAGTIGGYSDWHLPAICEMGYDATSSGTGCGSAVSPQIQNMQTNLVDNGNIGGLAGFYWSSTEYSASPQNNAISQYFAGSGASSQAAVAKSNSIVVRCTRTLTN